MAGPNLELLKFGMYVFFPIVVMVHYGDPDWYRKYVLPDKSEFLRLDRMAPSPPRNQSQLREELERLNKERAERREARRLQSSSVDEQQKQSLPNQAQSPSSTPTLPSNRLV